METYTIDTVPKGVPVQVLSGFETRFPTAKYAVVRDVRSTGYSRPGVERRIMAEFLRKNTWIPLEMYVGLNATQFAPLETKVSERVQKIHDRYFRKHLGERANSFRPAMGMDPEIFVVDGKTNKVIPAFGFLPDKRAPFRNSIVGESINAYWDGFQAEISTTSFGCLETMCNTVWTGLKTILQQARKKYPDAKLSHETVVTVDSDVLKVISDQHVALGCSTSHNAYGTPHIQVDDPRLLPFRFAGGHGHFGDDTLRPISTEQIEEIVKVLDSTIGVASVLWFQGLENPIRRQFYGRAGEYRRPKHGLEYRVLGNGWLIHPAIFHLVMGMLRKSYQFARYGFGKYLTGDSEAVREIIDSYDVKGAMEHVQRNKDIFKSILKAEVNTTTNVGFNLLESGVAEVLETPTDLEKNWHLELPRWWCTGGRDTDYGTSFDPMFWRYAVNNFLSKGQKI